MITDFSSIFRPLSSEFPPPPKRRCQADLVQNSTNFIFEYFVLKLFFSLIPVLPTTARGIHRTHDFLKNQDLLHRAAAHNCVFRLRKHTQYRQNLLLPAVLLNSFILPGTHSDSGSLQVSKPLFRQFQFGEHRPTGPGRRDQFSPPAGAFMWRILLTGTENA